MGIVTKIVLLGNLTLAYGSVLLNSLHCFSLSSLPFDSEVVKLPKSLSEPVSQ